ncbi:hypothetical protein PMIT1306_00257 [Prochlorococcus sp. MIT 1306]|nr:hypothetical protein PMIT1306_00257 [Prochlorococcus sp. MIT 1306]
MSSRLGLILKMHWYDFYQGEKILYSFIRD